MPGMARGSRSAAMAMLAAARPVPVGVRRASMIDRADHGIAAGAERGGDGEHQGEAAHLALIASPGPSRHHTRSRASAPQAAAVTACRGGRLAGPTAALQAFSCMTR